MNHAILTLTGLSHDGRAVGRLPEGMVVFVPNALPGQTVRVQIINRKKNMAEAVLAEVLSPSPEERTPPCPHHAHCGGCPWQSLPYPAQLRWKNRLLADALTRIGRISLERVGNATSDGLPPVLALPALAGEEQWGYRNKMEFSFGTGEEGTLSLGLRERDSRRVVNVTSCLLQTPLTMRLLAHLRELARESNLPVWRDGEANPPAALRFAVIREPRGGEGQPRPCLVEIITGPTSPNSPEAEAVLRIGQQLMEREPEVTGFVHSLRLSPTAIAYGEKTLQWTGQVTLEESLNLRGFDVPVTFHLDHASFFQVNSRGAELLYNTASFLAYPEEANACDKTETCWDVYCGVGGLALALSPYAREVLGLETVSQAVRLAKKNAAPYGNCRFEQANADHLSRVFQKYPVPDLLCADPPRAGLAKGTIGAILRARPAKLLMVSCNPATLARDLALLQEGYEIRAVQAVDMFPQTPHVEAVAVLSRTGRR